MNTITYVDGHTYRLLDINSAIISFSKGTEVYGLNIDEGTESLMESLNDLRNYHDLGVEIDDK